MIVTVAVTSISIKSNGTVLLFVFHFASSQEQTFPVLLILDHFTKNQFLFVCIIAFFESILYTCVCGSIRNNKIFSTIQNMKANLIGLWHYFISYNMPLVFFLCFILIWMAFNLNIIEICFSFICLPATTFDLIRLKKAK